MVWHDCIGWPVVCAGPDPGLLGGAVAVDAGAVVVGAWPAPGPPLGGAAMPIDGASAIDPAAMSSLTLRFMRLILSAVPRPDAGCAASCYQGATGSAPEAPTARVTWPFLASSRE